MDEVHFSPPYEKRELTPGEVLLLDESERTLQQRLSVILSERESNLNIYLNSNSGISQIMDGRDPSLRHKTAELYRQEIDALKALDLSTVSVEDIFAVSAEYQRQRDALVLN